MNALHLLDVLEYLICRSDASNRNISRALELQLDFPKAHDSLGNIHKDHEDWHTAKATYMDLHKAARRGAAARGGPVGEMIFYH